MSQVTYVTMVPRGNKTLRRKTLGECLQRYQALNHMCNQSNRWARHQRRVTSWPGSLKACEVQPALASRNEASSSRDAGNMSLHRNVSIPQGTMVTYVTWDVPLQELELHRKTLGDVITRCPRRQTCKSLPSVEEHSYGKITEEPGVARKSRS